MSQPNDNPAPPAPRMRWYQFTLRGLIGVVTLCAVAAYAYRTYVMPYERQRDVIELVKQLGGACQTVEAQEWWLPWFGTRQHVTQVILADCDEPDRYVDAMSRLPKLELLIVGGLKFADEHAAKLHWLESLQGLILDSTAVSDEAVAALRAALPDSDVYQSQRRAIRELTRGAGSSVQDRLNTSHPVLRQLAGEQWLKEADTLNVVMKVADDKLVHLRGFRQIRRLYLQRTEVTDAGLVHLRGLSHLQCLFLSEDQVTDAGLVHLSGLTQLESLNLPGTKVTGAGLAQLRGLTQVTELSLNGTPVTAAGLAHIRVFSQLQTLGLRGTQVTDAALLHLHGLSELQLVFADGTRVTDAGVAELKRALPNCHVDR